EPLRFADAGHGNAARGEPALDVDQARGAELAAKLAFLREPRDQPVESAVELARGSRHALAVEERYGENVGIQLGGRARLHLDSHRGAMLADAPRTLHSACKG